MAVIVWLVVTLIGIGAAGALGWIIGRGQKVNAAAVSVCPQCSKPLRDSRGHFIKAQKSNLDTL